MSIGTSVAAQRSAFALYDLSSNPIVLKLIFIHENKVVIFAVCLAQILEIFFFKKLFFCFLHSVFSES